MEITTRDEVEAFDLLVTILSWAFATEFLDSICNTDEQEVA